MKTGKVDIVDLAREISRQAESKVDFKADSRELVAEYIPASETVPAAFPQIKHDKYGEHRPNLHGHRQLARNWSIGARYYDEMLAENIKDDGRHILTETLNYWFQEKPSRHLIRSLDGDLRAFLSDSYRILDNDFVFESTMPVLVDEPGMEIVSCEVTDRRMYLKAVFPRIQADVKVGDAVQAGLVISNSEIGEGSVRVEPMLYRLVCLNGMVRHDKKMRKYHSGARAGGEESYQVFKSDTLQADDRAFQLKIRDIVKAGLDETAFNQTVVNMRESTEREITGDPIKACELIQSQYKLQDEERNSVLTHLLTGGDLSQYGLLNAVTRASQDVADYDRATDLERLGSDILYMPKNAWERVATIA